MSLTLNFYYSNIWYIYSLQYFEAIFFWVWDKIQNPILLLGKALFFHIRLGIYAKKRVRNGNLSKTRVYNKYAQEKRILQSPCLNI